MDGIMARLVQVGTVTAVDTTGRKARVQFPATGITSDWLCVIQQPLPVTVERPQVEYWMPEVGQTVLVLYAPVFNSDGFIMGVIV